MTIFWTIKSDATSTSPKVKYDLISRRFWIYVTMIAPSSPIFSRAAAAAPNIKSIVTVLHPFRILIYFFPILANISLKERMLFSIRGVRKYVAPYDSLLSVTIRPFSESTRRWCTTVL